MSNRPMGCKARMHVLRRHALLSASLLALTFAPITVEAQTYTWGGTGSSTTTTDYNLGTNWSNPPAGAPPVGAGTTAIFAGSGDMAVNVTAGPITPDEWEFTSGAYIVSGAAVNFDTAAGIVDSSSGNSVTLGNNIGGIGGITVTNGGTVYLNGDNSFTGAIDVENSSAIRLGNTNALGDNSGIALNGTGALNLAGFSVATASIAGNGSIFTYGADATLELTGTSSFAGRLQGGITGYGVLSLQIDNGTSVTLSGNSSYTGNTTIETGGALDITNTAALGSSTVVLNGGSLTIGIASGTLANNINVNTTGGTLVVDGSAINMNGNIGDGNGAGTLAYLATSNGGTFILDASDNHTGATVIGDGANAVRVSADSTTALNPLSDVTINAGGRLDVNANITIASLSGSGEISSSALSLTTLTVGDSSSTSFTGTILQTSGALALDKVGNGTLTLSGASSSYSGGTTISAGTVAFTTGNALGTGAVTLDGGTLQVGYSSGSIINTIKVNTTGGTFDVAGNSFQLGSTIQDGTGAGTLNYISSVNGGSIGLSTADNHTGATVIGDGTHAVTVAPNIAGALSSASAVTVNAQGTLNIVSSQTIASLTSTGGGTVEGSATLTIGDATSTSFNGTIEDQFGHLALVKTGSGTQLLVGNNTYSGGTTITAGVLQLNDHSAAGTGAIVLDGGTLQINFGGGFTNAIKVNTTGGAIDAAGLGVGLSGGIQDGNGAGTLTLESTVNNGDIDLTGAVYNTGATVIGDGVHTVAVGVVATGDLSSTSAITVNSDATLDIEADQTIASLTGTGAVNAPNGGAVTLTVLGGSSVFSGQIENTGGGTLALAKTGSGTFTISNATNSYSGGTIVSGGTLIAAVSGALGAGDVVLDGGTLKMGYSALTSTAVLVNTAGGTIDTDGGTTDFADGYEDGNGAGALTLMSSVNGGVIVLSTPSSNSGATVIGDGTHTFTANVSSVDGLGASSAFTVTANATLELTADATAGSLAGAGTVEAFGGNAVLTTGGNGDSTTFSGVLKDSGGALSLVKTGGGIMTLSGDNSYSGTTTIDGGELIVAPGGSLGTGAVIDNAAMVFDNSGTATVSNAISGSGTVEIGGGGTTIFTAGQGYSGATTIDTGSILVLNGASVSGAIVDNGTLAFADEGTLALTGGITGTGGFGAADGTDLVIDMAWAGTGTSIVGDGGVLQVGDSGDPNASLGGGVNVMSGGLLEGHGTINGAVTVASGGGIRPGGSIGTLTVNGAVSVPAGASFTEEYSGAAASKLVATGAVTLGGNLVLVPDSAAYTANTDYRFITGGSVSGTFASVTGANSTYTIQYSATAVDLILDPQAAARTPATTTFLFNTYGKTVNQVAAGAALTASSSTAALYKAAGGVVASNTAAVPGALGQLAGDIHPSLRSASIEDARMVRDAMLGHMNRDPDGPVLWAAGFGNMGSISDSNAVNLSHTMGGFLAGGDLPVVGDALRLGVSGGYSTDNAHTSGHLSTANGSQGHAGAYVTFDADQIHLNIGGDYGFGSVTIKRAVSALGAVLSDSQGQHSNQVFADLGYKLTDWPLEPYAGIARVSSQQSAFSETGGVAALSGASASDSETFTTLGLRGAFDNAFDLGFASLTPRLDLGWQHALARLTPGQQVTYTSTGQSFEVLGVPLSTDTAAIQAGVEMKTGDTTFFLTYDGNFASRVSENGLNFGLDWQF